MREKIHLDEKKGPIRITIGRKREKIVERGKKKERNQVKKSNNVIGSSLIVPSVRDYFTSFGRKIPPHYVGRFSECVGNWRMLLIDT